MDEALLLFGSDPGDITDDGDDIKDAAISGLELSFVSEISVLLDVDLASQYSLDMLIASAFFEWVYLPFLTAKKKMKNKVYYYKTTK